MSAPQVILLLVLLLVVNLVGMAIMKQQSRGDGNVGKMLDASGIYHTSSNPSSAHGQAL